jgi:hypothetical protein
MPETEGGIAIGTNALIPKGWALVAEDLASKPAVAVLTKVSGFLLQP